MVPGAMGVSTTAGGAPALPYPDRFHAAAVYAGFAPESRLASKSSSINFSDDTALLLYSLHQQDRDIASRRQPDSPLPRCWNQLGNMAKTEAMRLFVRTLEEEDPGWYKKSQEEKTALIDEDSERWSKAHGEISESIQPVPLDVAATVEAKIESEPIKDSGAESNASPKEILPVSTNGTVVMNGTSTEAKIGGHDSVVEQKAMLSRIHDQWFSPEIKGRRPAARYQHAAAIVGNWMFVIGGNHNGRYLNDVQVLDLDTYTWSKVDQKAVSSPSSNPAFPPCAGHSLVQSDMKLLMVAGHSKEQSNTVTVRAFDTTTLQWSKLPSYGQAPVARGGQTVTKVGSILVMFGGEDSKRRLYNDLNILDLETMTWDAIEAGGTTPSPRSDHSAAVHGDRYLFIFGGGSHSSCFNDLHVLDLETMEWSQPQQQGFIPSARAGHAGVTVGDNWYIIGGGDNKSGISDTLVLNMATLVWHVVATENGRTPIASEGLSVVAYFAKGEESLISFGGYNGRYSNEIHKFIASPAPEKATPKVLQSAAAAAAAASAAAAFAVPRPLGVKVPVNENGDDKTVRMEAEVAPLKSVEPEPPARSVRDVAPEIEESSARNKLREELEAAQAEVAKSKRDLASALLEYSDLEQELQSVRAQLANEQSRCFRLEVDVAELRQKLQTMDSLQKEIDLLHRQKAAAEEAAVNAAQKPNTGVWGWLQGGQADQKSVSV